MCIEFYMSCSYTGYGESLMGVTWCVEWFLCVVVGETVSLGGGVHTSYMCLVWVEG